ncbi:MAG: replication factor C large subunit [Candidatus Hadarchaeum sp.]|uniref:replication factor C large subunit n=1 Tax=Candidatus Hadarchaeum sp. TaxID=2883567 RepID=UPI003D152C25
MSELPWVEKYRPKSLREIVGQPKAISLITRWAQSWERGRPAKAAALFYGPAGTGKSAAAAALASDFGWDLIEMNASDQRNLAEVKRVAGTAASTGTLFGGTAAKRLIVLDEADSIYGTADRGGYSAIKEIIAETHNPLVLIANDKDAIPWEIKAACLMVEFGRIGEEVILKELARILHLEKIDFEELALKVIAETARGDLRSAITDLQTLTTGKKRLTIKDVVLYRRDQEIDIESFLAKLLEATSADEARKLLWSLDLPPEDALAWISENIPLVVDGVESRAKVYEAISRADIFLGRAKRGQAYGMWSYAGDLMSAGVSLSRGEELKPVKAKLPSHIWRYSRTRADRAVRDSLTRKIAAHCHTSSRTARRDILPYLRIIFKNDRKTAEAIVTALELTEPELGFLR